MQTWLRRVRGAIGLGVTWAAGWAPIGALTGWITGIFLGFPLAIVTVNYAVMFGALGFLGGTIFSTVLSHGEGNRGFHDLSLPRFVGWGALGGFILGGVAVAAGLLGPGFTVLDAVIAGVTTIMGAGSAAGTLVVARAAESPAALEEGEVTERSELTGEASPERVRPGEEA